MREMMFRIREQAEIQRREVQRHIRMDLPISIPVTQILSVQTVADGRTLF
jgi:hypothetical protein